MKVLHDVYLGLGTNLGNREENLDCAIKNIEERIGQVQIYSSFFVTAPVGFDSENLFLNAACCVKTSQTPDEVLKITQSIERDMGRASKSVNQSYSDRIIDIDILLYDDLITKSEELILPHPHLHEREFVLLPLCEIAEKLVHPIFKKTLGELKEML